MDSGIVRSRRRSQVEYQRLKDCGVLREGDPVELVGGHLVVKEPQYTPHATATRLVVRALEAVFTTGWDVRAALPIAFHPDSEPEPDVSVVRGGPRGLPRRPPRTPGARGRSRRLEPRLRPPAQGEPLRAGSAAGLLDSESGRSPAGSEPRAGTGPGRGARLELPDGHCSQSARPRRAPGRTQVQRPNGRPLTLSLARRQPRGRGRAKWLPLLTRFQPCRPCFPGPGAARGPGQGTARRLSPARRLG